jgi:hypothetical protein
MKRRSVARGRALDVINEIYFLIVDRSKKLQSPRRKNGRVCGV